MFFIILTFCAALFIEGLGSLVSVIGISALFGANAIIIALAIALDVGKVVTVSLLYTYWRELSRIMKGYALLAAAVTMIITSAGAAGYLSGEFQKAILGTKEGELKVNVLKEQQAKYQDRKKQIDDQIANLPAKTTVNQRLRLMNGFKAEQKALDEKIAAIDQQLPEQQMKQIGTEAKAGPILYISKAFNVSVEEAVKWVILLIIVVFDPLAIFLIISGNFLLARRREALAKTIVQEEVVKENADEPEHIVRVPSTNIPCGNEFPPGLTGQLFYHTGLRHLFVYRANGWEPMKHPQIEEPMPAPPPPVEQIREPIETAYETYSPPAEPIVPPEPEPEPVEVQLTPEPEEEEEQEHKVMTEPIQRRESGLLRPIEVEAPDQPAEIQNANYLPLHIPEKPAIEVGPIEDTPPPREQITRSSLGMTPPDPHTIVNARHEAGFRKSTAAKSTNTK